MRFFRVLFLTVLVLFMYASMLWAFQAQLGTPHIQNIPPEEYNARVQNWNAAQHPSGIIYIANLGGVLEYDGERWRTIEMPNTTALSVGVHNDTVFVGGVSEIGYLYTPKQDSAHIRYRSLTDRIPKSNAGFGDVWQVIPTQHGVYFRTGQYLFRYQEGTLDSWEAETGFHFAFNVRNELYINVREKGLHKMVDGQLQLVPNGETFAEDGIYAMESYGNKKILMATRYKDLVLYDGSSVQDFQSQANAFLEEHRLYNGIKLSDGTFVFGTVQEGIIRINRRGKILNIINEENGMLDDVVYNLFEDREGNLWVSQDQGLSVINIMSPVTVFDKRHGLEGMPRAMYADEEDFLVGTTHGFYQRKNGMPFEKVDNYEKVAQDFVKSDGRLLFVSSKGLFQLIEGQTEEKLQQRYASCITQSSVHPGFYYLCARDGLYLIRENTGEFTKLGKIEGIESEVNSVAEDADGNVWVSVPTKGIYQLWWDNSSQQLLKPHLRLRAMQKNRPKVFKIGNEILFGFKEAFMRYDANRDSLVDNISLETEFFNDANPGIFLLAKGNDQHFWLRSAEINMKVIRQEDGNFKQQPSYLNLIQSNQYNFIYPDAQGMVWFGTDEGLLRYDPQSPYDYTVDYNAFVREVKVHNDSLIYSGPRKNSKNYVLQFNENELRFRYAAPTFVRKNDVEYQIFLEGFDKGWSNWTTETRKDYTNIPEGNYTFKVRARNIQNKISKAGTFRFSVLPPWYRTIWAYGLYLLIIGGILYGLHRLRINRILREQRIRNRIASDLHDEVSASLSSITYFAEAIRQVKSGKRRGHFVELISESASDAKEKITDIIWSIDPDNDDWVNLLSKCRRFASDLFESKNMDYELHIDTDIDRPLGLELRQHLWLIFKEMAVNAARHSQADKVEVQFGMNSNTLKLVVQDNGIGIDESLERSGGHGIKNIKKRAQQIGADLQLETDAEIGTRWIMTLKIR